MASYPALRLLSQLDASKPASGAPISENDDAIRQLKAFLRSFLGQSFNDDGTLKDVTIATAMLADGCITNDELATDALSALDKIVNSLFSADSTGRGKFATGFVDSSLLEDGAVTTAKIADLAVTDVELADSAVIERVLAANSVSTTKVQDLAITAAKMANSLVLNGKVVDKGIDTAALACTSGRLIAGNASGVAKAVKVQGAVSIAYSEPSGDPTLTFTITGTAATAATYALYAETSPLGDSPASVAGGWTSTTDRGSWSLQTGSVDFMKVTGNKLQFTSDGSYLIRASVPGFSCGLHKIRLRDTSATPATMIQGACSASSPGTMTRAELVGVLAVTGASVGSPKEYYIQHWTEIAATNGLGLDINTGGDDTFHSLVEIVKIS